MAKGRPWGRGWSVDEDYPFEVQVLVDYASNQDDLDVMHQWVLNNTPDHRLRLAQPSPAKMWCFRFTSLKQAGAFHSLFGGTLITPSAR